VGVPARPLPAVPRLPLGSPRSAWAGCCDLGGCHSESDPVSLAGRSLRSRLCSRQLRARSSILLVLRRFRVRSVGTVATGSLFLERH